MDIYPDNRLIIRIDTDGKANFEQDPVFAEHYFRRTADEAEEELENLRDDLAELEVNEPFNAFSIAHDEWEDRITDLEDRIRELEQEIEDFHQE